MILCYSISPFIVFFFFKLQFHKFFKTNDSQIANKNVAQSPVTYLFINGHIRECIFHMRQFLGLDLFLSTCQLMLRKSVTLKLPHVEKIQCAMELGEIELFIDP